MESFADSRCELCCNLFRYNFQHWTWVLDATGYWYKFCPNCTCKAEKSLDHALKNAGGPMIERMVGTRLLDIKKSGIAGAANDDFAKRRRL